MSSCNNLNQNCTENNIYVSGAETRTVIEVSNNKSRYYAELAETYKNKAKEYCDNARYYSEQNSDVSINDVNNLEATLRNLINSKQDAGEYALASAIPAKTSDLTNDSGYITSSALSGYATETWVGNQGYITGIGGSDVTTALGYTPAENDLSNLSATSSTNFDGLWVKSEHSLAYDVASPTTTSVEYDLSSYLPNDNYSYEVLFVSSAATGSASNNQCLVSLSNQYFDNVYLCRAHTRNSYVARSSGSAILPIGSNHKISVNAWSGNTGTYSLIALAYRRIGTNS